MGVDVKTIGSYLDLMADLFLIRRLQPWHANVGKRLVKSPRIYLPDSGLLHALLDIGERDGLLSHPIVGAEIDLLLVFPGRRKWAIEVKRGPNPKPERGFHEAGADLDPVRRFTVYPGADAPRPGSWNADQAG